MRDPADTRTPAMRKRDSVMRILRYSALSMIAFGAAFAALGLVAIGTSLADDPSLFLVMGGILLVMGTSSYAMARSFGPSLAPDQWTPEAVRRFMRGMGFRNVLMIVTVSALLILFALLRRATTE